MKHLILKVGVGLAFMLLWGCGPSPEQIATMTAAAWTPTPLPTATPTPLPYDLTLTVTNTEGAPVSWAQISINGKNAQAVDPDGKLVLTNMPSPEFSGSVSAQGYTAQDTTATLQHGPNEVTVTLERAAFGLLPSEACAPGETPLYVEDFQDGTAEGWSQVISKIDGWMVGEHPEETGNMSMIGSSDAHVFASLAQNKFENAVWRIQYRVDGRRWVSFNWLQAAPYVVDGQAVDDSRYQIIVRTDGSEIHRITLPVANITLDRGANVKAPGWHKLEISSFQGLTQVWLDGGAFMETTDPQPLPSGSIALEIFDSQTPDSLVYFDNISVCELTSAFTSLYAVP